MQQQKNSPNSNGIFGFLSVIIVFLLVLSPTLIKSIISGSKSGVDGGIVGIVAIIIMFLSLAVIVGLGGLRVINQYERAVVLTLGKYTGTRNPGLTWIFPGIQRIIKPDLRITTVDIPQQEVITKDNVTVGINAVVYFRVAIPERAVLEIQDYSRAVALYAQATLRDIVGGVELDAFLSERDKIADEIKKIVDVATDPWGIDVTIIKIQDIELPADMKRAMAKQAETERERRAVIIKAHGELSASENLKKAAENLTSVPGGLSLRTLATIENINPDPSKMVIFALPVEVLEGFKSLQNLKEKQK
ncbi:MAG: slipin family protein [Patescibacteria group bacterium]|nr:slipin family protein [Patescibacteria group bacterium]